MKAIPMSIWKLLLLSIAATSTTFAASTNFTTRIVGGTQVTDPNAYPFFGHGTDGQLCGGTFVARDIFLTAAHCAPAFETFVFRQSRRLYATDSPETLRIEQHYPHPDYTPGPEWNDIMLMKLSALSEMSNNDLALPNFNANRPRQNTPVTAIGFGQLSEDGSLSNTLRETTMLAVAEGNCADLLGNGLREEMHLCAGGDGERDACGGDSGGPLLDANDMYRQYGVTSFGVGCARPDKPGVYTRVSHYQAWITKLVCDESRDPPTYLCQDVRTETAFPTARATPEPTETPTTEPTEEMIEPTSFPTVMPTNNPTRIPTSNPTNIPTNTPSDVPTSTPTHLPTAVPTTVPSNRPSIVPSRMPSAVPSVQTSSLPSALPSTVPSNIPSRMPSLVPSPTPSVWPSNNPSMAIPSSVPSPLTTTTTTVREGSDIPITTPVITQGPTTTGFVAVIVTGDLDNAAPRSSSNARRHHGWWWLLLLLWGMLFV